MGAPAKKSEPRQLEKRLAQAHECALSASVQAAAAMEPWTKRVYGEADLGKLVADTGDRIKAVCDGDMRPLEAMLVGQASALQSMFVDLSRRAAIQQQLPQFQAHLSLAFKAQAQCRSTIEALAELRNPRPLAIVQQANIAHGPQQVNNGAAPPAQSRATSSATEQNELLEARHERQLDTRTTGTAVPGDPALEAVAELDRAAHG